MSNQPTWVPTDPSQSIQRWADFLHSEAKRLFRQDHTHGSMLFSFKQEQGLVSVNMLPTTFDDYNELNEAIAHAAVEYDLYGVIFIGEAWMYFIKENDHTAFQLLDGEMKVSDLNKEDKKESLMLKMESRSGDCMTYLNEILRNEDGPHLQEEAVISRGQTKWFATQNIAD